MEETKLYNESVVIRLSDKHVYTVSVDEGKFSRRKSVTGISGLPDKSKQLIPWALEEGAKELLAVLETGRKITELDIVQSVFASQDTKEKAANVGTAIHDLCEQYIKSKLLLGPEPELPKDETIALGYTAFLEWEASHEVKFLWTEKLLYSKKHNYCGKADFGAIVNGRRDLCDIKTGNGLYNGVRTQTAGYVIASEEESDDKWEGRWAIRLAKETEPEYLERMKLKNHIKRLLGKNEVQVQPYLVFEAIDLDRSADSESHMMEYDKEAFLNELAVSIWNGATQRM